MKKNYEAYMFWFKGLFGILCLHRKYCKIPATSTRKSTLNYLFIGSFIDLFLIPKWVIKENNILKLKQLEKDLETLQQLKAIVLREQNFESAKWYRDKEVLLQKKIKEIKK
ncbi:MAG: hypothetical protein ACOVO1_04325 [Chitinophagaceae bacterium]